MADDGDWGEMLSDLSVLEAESDDGDAFTEDEEIGEDEPEFDPITVGLGMAAAKKLGLGRRRTIHRARPSNYAQAVQGKSAGIVYTPNGPARISLPGSFPTVDEFKKAVTGIQKDMKVNSAGIKELADQQKKDIQRLAELITKLDRREAKRAKRTQIVSWLGLAASISYPMLRRIWPNL